MFHHRSSRPFLKRMAHLFVQCSDDSVGCWAFECIEKVVDKFVGLEVFASGSALTKEKMENVQGFDLENSH